MENTRHSTLSIRVSSSSGSKDFTIWLSASHTQAPHPVRQHAFVVQENHRRPGNLNVLHPLIAAGTRQHDVQQDQIAMALFDLIRRGFALQRDLMPLTRLQ